MIRKALVSSSIIKILKTLKYLEITPYKRKYLYREGYDNNNYTSYRNGKDYGQIYVPTVDEVIDWLRRKYNIVIYNSIEPFVDPAAKKPRILYRYSVKKCNLRDGWNGRKYIGESKLVENIYSAKRQAIMLAIRYIKSQKNDKRRSTLDEQNKTSRN